jgi:hypothetical protein
MKTSLGAIIGGVFGVFIVLGMMSPPFDSWVDSTWFEVLHYPALLYFKIERAFNLPVRWDVDLFILVVSIILQWIILGYFVGLIFQTVKRILGKK